MLLKVLGLERSKLWSRKMLGMFSLCALVSILVAGLDGCATGEGVVSLDEGVDVYGEEGW